MTSTSETRLRAQRDAARREVQIGKALDGIRQRVQAMQTPDDISGVVEQTRDAFAHLGVEPAFTRCVVRDRRGYMASSWIAWPDEAAQGPVRVNLRVARERGADQHFPDLSRRRWSVSTMNKTQHRAEWRRSRHAFDPPFSAAHAEQLLDRYPNPNVRHTFAFPGGFLGIDLDRELPPDEMRLGRRVAQAFGAAWQRLQELRELQQRAREAEVEAGLERVRAQALAMQSPDDLPRVSAALFREARQLFDAVNSCISVVDEAAGISHEWTVLPGEMRLGPGVPWRIVHEGEVPVALIDQPLRIVRRFDPIYRRAFRAASPDKPRRHAVRWTSAHGIRIASRFLEAGLWTESVVRDVSRAWKTLWSNGLSFTVVQHRHGYSFINTLEPLADERVDEWERFTDLFAFAYDRYLELRERDARNRELQVQNALERVRAQASGMQQSADLEAVSLTLLETARTLIPTIVRDFVIIDQEGEGQDYWTASLVGGETPTTRPRGQVGVFTAAQTNAARADGASYFPYTETGGPHYDDVYGYRVFHEHGWISFGSTAYLADTDVGVLERLTEVFGFAYQRFLELADKERRAREAEVQVALEKIRAQALSMQGTDDLPALSSALFRELDGLGLPVLQSLISVLHEDRDEFEEWTTVLPGLQDLMDNYGTVHSDLAPAVVHARNSLSWFHVVVPEWAEAWRSWLDYGQDVFTLRWTRAQMRRSGQAYVRRGWWTKQYLKAVLADLPKELDQCLVHYRHGRFVFNLSRSLTDDELGVLRRIADVFCFAYDRFLELQLKEQRAREAEIEVSLERVRARALGMQQSDNLADVTEVLFQELKRLGLDPLHAIIGVDEDDAVHEYIRVDFGDERPPISQLRYPKARLHEPFAEGAFNNWGQSESEAEFALHFDGDRVECMLAAHSDDSIGGATPTPDDLGEFYQRGALFPGFFLILNTRQPASDESFAILQRCGRVFAVAYRRFRELQDKEAQNRELTIQNALERVRARALGMQSTDDLPAVAAAVFREAEHLDFEVIYSAIGIVQGEQGYIDQWGVAGDLADERHMAMIRQRFPVFDEDPPVVRERFDISKVRQVHPYVERAFRISPRRGEIEHESAHLTPAELTSWIDNMGKLGIWDSEYTAHAPRAFPDDGLHISTFQFDHGYIWFYARSALGPQQVAEAERFTEVFAFAYDRWLQLQSREQHTREAQLDAAAERVRAAAMDMHSADEIRTVVGVVRNQLIDLGFSDRFPITINHFDATNEDHFNAYFASPVPHGATWDSARVWEIDERTIAGVIPMSMAEFDFDLDQARREILYFEQDINEVNLNSLAESAGMSLQAFTTIGMGSHITLIPFTHGQIGVRGDAFITEEQIDVVRQLCDGLSLGFTRFQDFQQLEADTERARIERGAERIRAEAQAMQSTHDLHRVVGVVHRQLLELGFEKNSVTLIFHHGEDDPDRVHTYAAFGNPRQRGRTWSSQILIELDKQIVAFRHIYDYTDQPHRLTQDLRDDVVFGAEISPEHMRVILGPIGYDDLEAEVQWTVDHQSHYSHVRFSNGNLVHRSTRHLDEREIDILKTFGDALSLGLVRFADFQRLEQASVNKSQFLRRMSHDLRSPMNAIIGYSRLLRRRLADQIQERDARNLANIETSSGNLLNLINDILDLSRIEAGRIEVSARDFDPRKLATECADALESIVKEGVVLRRDLDDVGSINSDVDRLRQVLMNLLGNATKFTDAGSITLSLKRVPRETPLAGTSSAGPVGGDRATDSCSHLIEITIADTGIGIPPEDLPHIFDEFRQVERQGGEQTEGTGLGLAIAKKTVDLLGGQISATSQVGVGTTFTVRLEDQQA